MAEANKNRPNTSTNQPAAQPAAPAPAPFKPAFTVNFDPSKIKVKKQVTLTVLKQKTDVTEYFRIETVIRVSEIKNQKAGGDGDKKMEPAKICEVTNLQDGRRYIYIANDVFAGSLREQYEKDSYVGKSFAVTPRKDAQKRYKNYEIAEIEVG